MDWVPLVLTVSATVFALLAVELEDLLKAILSLFFMCVSIAGIFWILGAPYVAIFQLLIYAGAIVILFLATIMLTERGGHERIEGRDILGILASIALGSTLLLLVWRMGMPPSVSVVEPALVEEGSKTIGQDMSAFLWSQRGFEIILQGTILFASSLCCLALMRRKKEGLEK
ncbi:NADH-quinone oxidoreductase subunit J [Candidatus Bathyarchaeota archaeon]|nr:NADH-quinone oxidoreductase subunit J [Candidatus Bathyarchaeota archaeon]